MANKLQKQKSILQHISQIDRSAYISIQCFNLKLPKANRSNRRASFFYKRAFIKLRLKLLSIKLQSVELLLIKFWLKQLREAFRLVGSISVYQQGDNLNVLLSKSFKCNCQNSTIEVTIKQIFNQFFRTRLILKTCQYLIEQ